MAALYCVADATRGLPMALARDRVNAIATAAV